MPNPPCSRTVKSSKVPHPAYADCKGVAEMGGGALVQPFRAPSTDFLKDDTRLKEGALISVTRTLSDKKKIAPAGSDTPDKVEFLNLWQPTPVPATLHRMTPMALYDINTKLPFQVLETDEIRLEPLVVSLVFTLKKLALYISGLTPACETSGRVHVPPQGILGRVGRYGALRNA